MPKDNIERAIKKAAGGDGETYEEIRYAGFGPGGVGVIVEALTDNRNRTASDVRSIFSKNGGNLGETGAVSFGFDQKGAVRYLAEIGDEVAVLEAAMEAGAEDVASDEESHEIYCAPTDLNEVAAALEAAFGAPQSAKLIWRPQNSIEVTGDQARTLLNLMDALEDHDDVQNVYANFDISDTELEALAS